MSKIKTLDKRTVSKIAAGEVIERPASVVKELLENAIDAKAKNIKIMIEDGGKKSILVIDDGLGMDKEDLLVCFKPHTTSKINSIEDLNKLQTLGFRGEALHSIASVSYLTIKSKPKSKDIGYQINVVAGKLKDQFPVGTRKGTEVKVQNLFFNLPVRKKFLKSKATEFRHILNVVEKEALIAEKVNLKLYHNSKLVLNLPSGDIENRIEKLFKINLKEKFSKAELIEKDIRIKGFVAKPQFIPYLPKIQHLIVNKRYIKNNFLIKKALKAAFNTLIPEKSEIYFLIFLELPNNTFDINIHPKKEEIKFSDPMFIFKKIKEFSKKIIETPSIVYTPSVKKEARRTQQKFYFTLKEKGEEKKAESFSLFDQAKETYLTEPSKIKYLQIMNLFIIFEHNNKLVIADQHAAHERVLYEKILKQFETQAKSFSQALLLPEIIEPNLTLFHQIEKIKTDLEKIGFKLEKFGQTTYKLTNVPFILTQVKKPIKLIFMQVVKEIIKNKEKKPYSIEKILSTLACKAAVKAGDKLSEEEIQEIIKSLEKTQIKYTCPHGRPTHIIISKTELEKLFKRKG